MVAGHSGLRLLCLIRPRQGINCRRVRETACFDTLSCEASGIFSALLNQLTFVGERD